MATKYPGTIESANTNEFGIVYADQVAGFKTVATLTELYNISDAILSKSKNNTNNDAIGQEWWVNVEGYFYRLTNWAKRKTAEGWTKVDVDKNLRDHINNHENPHQVTKGQVGLGNVDNTADTDKPVSNATIQELNKKVDKTTTVNNHPLSSNVQLTKEDIGLGNVDNTSDLDKPTSRATQDKLDIINDNASWKGLASGTVRHRVGVKNGYDQLQYRNVIYFTTDTNEIILNGLSYGLINLDLTQFVGSVTYDGVNHKLIVHYLDNETTADVVLPIAGNNTDGLLTAQYFEKFNNFVESKGVPGGVASLDSSGKIPASQLPSSVDQIVDVADYASLPVTGADNIIYHTLDDNKSYRWSGTTYVEISSSLALGTTSSTAYPGNLGETNRINIQQLQTEMHDTPRLGDQHPSGIIAPETQATTATKALNDWDDNDIRGTYAGVKSKIDGINEIDITGSTTYYLRQIRRIGHQLYKCKKTFIAGATFDLNEYFVEVDYYQAFIQGDYYVS